MTSILPQITIIVHMRHDAVDRTFPIILILVPYKIAGSCRNSNHLILDLPCKSMKLDSIVTFLFALQTVNSFSFPTATLFQIPESTTESTTESTEAPPKRVSQKALRSALRQVTQIRLTLLKNLQVIGKFIQFLKHILSTFETYLLSYVFWYFR